MKRPGGGENLDPRFSYFEAPPLHHIINDQSLMIVHFQGLVLLSLSEITGELCKLMVSTSQEID